MRIRTIRARMILLIALPTLAIYVGGLGVLMLIMRVENRAEVESEMTRLARNLAARFDGAFRELAVIATSTAHFMETNPDLTEAQIYALLRANTLQNPAAYGAAMAFVPGTVRGDDELYCPYVYRTPDGLREMNITRDVYDWYGDERWLWWQVPKRTGRGGWTDPFFDEGAGNVLMVTYSEPFFAGGALRGVTTVDIMLPTLQNSIGRDILDDLRFVILTSDGRYVYSPVESNIMRRTVYEVAEAGGRPDIADAARQMLSGESGVTVLEPWENSPDDWAGWNERVWVFYAPIASTGWAFAALLPEREALASVHRRLVQATAGLAVTLALIVGCIWFVSGRLARPITRLRAKVLEIAGGNLEVRVDQVDRDDEIGELAASFNRMTADLREHVEHLATERAGRAKIERDLDLAREIQRGLMPAGELHVPGYAIAGWNQPADKTGGDYFDWLQLPDGRTIVTLADVTGHGIGPALIVAVCRAYMRASTSTGEPDLPTALARVNDLLHGDIPAGRFVTAAVGLLDPAHHRMRLVSAGQAPLLFYEAATDTVHNWDADDLPLGIMGGLTFDEAREINFEPGDVLVLATDGFFEWPDESGRHFGTGGLVAFVHEHHELAPDVFIERLYAKVRAHGAGDQPDDLTAVVIRRV